MLTILLYCIYIYIYISIYMYGIVLCHIILNEVFKAARDDARGSAAASVLLNYVTL